LARGGRENCSPEAGTGQDGQFEDELRTACAVGDIRWTYLRFVRDVTDHGGRGWHLRRMAGHCEGDNDSRSVHGKRPLSDLRAPIMVAFRTAQERLSEAEATERSCETNLFGLEIDPRCTQIAAFNLAFAAWRVAGIRVLPAMNLACSGLPPGVSKAEWLKLAERAATSAPSHPSASVR